jgi:tetratricopeptide (TPR) repeat protein/O-antigen ligase
MENKPFGNLQSISISFSTQIWFSTFILLPLIIYFRFTLGTWLLLDKDFPTYRDSAWIIGLIMLTWIVWKWLFDNKLLLTGVELYLGIFYLVMCLSTLFSQNTGLSLEKLIGISVYFLGIYLLIDLKRSPAIWQGLINAILITGSLSSLTMLYRTYFWVSRFQLSLTELLSNPAYTLRLIPRLPDYNYLHPSVTAGYLILIIPLGIYQFRQSKRIFWKVLNLLAILLNLAMLFLTRSRGGYLGLIGYLITLALIRNKSWIAWLQDKKYRAFLIGSLILITIAGSILFIFQIRGFSFTEQNMLIRYQGWLTSLRIIRDYPLLGSGLGTFGEIYLNTRDPAIDPSTLIHAHNQLLQITVELGLLGLITFLLVFWKFFHNITKQKISPQIHTTAIPALTGIFCVLLPDAIFTSANIVLLFLFYLVWILPPSNDQSLLKKSGTYTVLTAAALLVMLGTGWNIWKLEPYHQAILAAREGNWTQAKGHLILAQKRDPQNTYYQQALGYSVGQVACQTGIGYQEALDYYTSSLIRYPRWGIDHTNTALLYSEAGDYKKAAKQMELAIQYQPETTFYKCLLGEIFLEAGDDSSARKALGACIAENPKYLQTPFWYEDKSKRDITQSVLQEAVEILVDQGTDTNLKSLALIQLYRGEIEKASQTIQVFLLENQDDLDGNLIYLEILIVKGDYQSAAELLDSWIKVYPRYGNLWLWKGKLAQIQGQAYNAQNLLRISFYMNPKPETEWLLDENAYLKEDLIDTVLINYQAPVNLNYTNTFSHHVAARWHLPGIYIDCMPSTKLD